MASKLLIPIKQSGNASPLFFVPSAGTTVLSLVHLARSLGDSHPLYAFELSELPSCEGGQCTVQQIASLCVDEIRAVQGTGPYFLGGHCWGGVVAFEIATRFEATGDRVKSLVLLESVPPLSGEAAASDAPPTDRPEIVKAVTDLCDQVRANLARLPKELVGRFNSMSWELIGSAIRYHTTARISAPLFLIRTPRHPRAVFEGWSHLTSGDFEECIVPGDAFSLLAPPAAKVVAMRLSDALLRHGTRSPGTAPAARCPGA